jgi:hypothetical protein
VKSIRALKKQYGNRNLAVGHCWQLQKWTRAMLGPGKGWLLSAEGCLAVQEWHGIRDAVIQGWWLNGDDDGIGRAGTVLQGNLNWMDVGEETLGATGMQQLHKEPRPKRAITSGKQENT